MIGESKTSPVVDVLSIRTRMPPKISIIPTTCQRYPVVTIAAIKFAAAGVIGGVGINA